MHKSYNCNYCGKFVSRDEGYYAPSAPDSDFIRLCCNEKCCRNLLNSEPRHSNTPRPSLSVLDQMVAFMLDHFGRDDGITTEDLQRAGFNLDEIGNHGNQAATIARRRMIRQVQAA